MRIGKFASVGPLSGVDRNGTFIFVPTHRQEEPIATNGLNHGIGVTTTE
jgi:hypothetical protein